MKLTSSLCNERTSSTCTSSVLGISTHVGCTRRPQWGSLFCKHHQLPDPPRMPEIREHKVIQGQVHFRYAGSDAFLPLSEVDAARVRQYDSRLALLDYATRDPARFGAQRMPLDEDVGNLFVLFCLVPRIVLHTHTHTSVLIFQSYAFNRPFVLQCQVMLGMHATDYDAIQTCNCLKDERKRLAVRRYAGVFVVVLPCGHIVVVRHLVGAEGLPQVAVAFADALNATQGKKFLCYDNACALARFCRNPIRAAHMECFQHCRFVLPESHARGHTACLDPTHTHYLPEVRKAAHPELTGVNTEAQEHVFSWVRWLTHVANPMTPVRHRSFFLLLILCLARNRYRHVGLRMRATPRKRRTWRIWPGVRQGARSAAVVEPNPQVQEANNMEAQPALPDQVANLGAAIPPPPPPPEPLPGYLLNLRDGKLHRLASLHRLACGASLPRQSRCLHSRDEVQRSKLCLRNGCFSPGAQP